LKLLPWQKFIYYNLFGFKYKGDKERRRYRNAFIEISRKNGKTTGFLYPLTLYDLLTTDAAESYMFSATEAQSKKSFGECVGIIQHNQELAAAVNITSETVTLQNSRLSFFSAEGSGMDGYRTSLAVIDEFWDYKTDTPVTASRYAGRARLNNLTLIISSAGLSIDTPCYAELQKAHKILDGILTDDSYFCITYEYDAGDKWDDADLLQKANPSLGTILKKEILLGDLTDAINTPSHRADYCSKTCGIWQQGISTWIPAEKLSVNSNIIITPDDLAGQRSCGAWDLSSVHDWTAFSLCFSCKDKFTFIHHFYVPADTIAERYKNENISLAEWIDNGLVTVIPGSTIDYSWIYRDIQDAVKKYDVKEIAFDPWNAGELSKKIDDEIPSLVLVPVQQSLKVLAPQTKSFEKMVLDNRLIDNNPVIKWMFGNVCIKPDAEGNYKPLKQYKSSTSRIDGVITSILSYNRLIVGADVKPAKTFEQILHSF
jgi:phage terminase large subunit-like protein